MSADRFGAQDLPTVVLVHSSGSSSRQWESLAQALRPSFQVHAVDLHGHGERPPWQRAAPLALTDDAELARPFMTHGDVHLVGHSYGAAVAVTLALTHPRQVRSLVAFEPVMMPWLLDDDPNGAASQALLAIAALLRASLLRGRPDEAARHFIDYWSGAGQWAAMPPARRTAMAARMPAIAAHFDALSAGLPTPQEVRALAQRVPSLWLSGSQTVVSARRVAELLRETLPGALHESLAGAGHMGPITHATDFNARVLRFLRDRNWHAAGVCALPGP